ncbi:MAG: hypothetical protein ACFFCS_16690 [Candidatus Hodarchaeota archaeon]
MLFTFNFQDILDGKGPLVEYAGDDKKFIDVIISLLESINKDLTPDTTIELGKIAVVSAGGKVLSKDEVKETSREIQQKYGDRFTITLRSLVGGHNLSELVSLPAGGEMAQAIAEKDTEKVIDSDDIGLPSLSTAGSLKDLVTPTPEVKTSEEEGELIKKEVTEKAEDKEKLDFLPPSPAAPSQPATTTPAIPTPPPPGGMGPPSSAKTEMPPEVIPTLVKKIPSAPPPAVKEPEPEKVVSIEPVIVEKPEEEFGEWERTIEDDESSFAEADLSPAPSPVDEVTGKLSFAEPAPSPGPEEEIPEKPEDVILDYPTPPPVPDESKTGRKKAKGKKAAAMGMPRKMETFDMEEEMDLELPHAEAVVERPRAEIFDKNISVEYFDRMNPESYYPLIVDIANLEQKLKAIEENIITGERKIQKKEKIHVKLEIPIVTVKPIFPGCTITPTELKTDFKDEEDNLVFYVTPLVRNKIAGHIEFIDHKGDVFQKIKTPAKCKDPRHARVIAAYGLLASMVPKIMEFFNVNLDELFSGITGALSGGWTFAGIFAASVSAFAVLFAVIYFLKQRPTMARKRFHFTDFKMALVADEVIRIANL